MSFFYDEFFARESFPAQFAPSVVRTALEKLSAVYDPADDSAVWFDKLKAVTAELGFATDMKAYKADSSAWPGSVADVSNFLRLAVTGRTNSPDLYSVMQLLGPARCAERLKSAVDSL